MLYEGQYKEIKWELLWLQWGLQLYSLVSPSICFQFWMPFCNKFSEYQFESIDLGGLFITEGETEGWEEAVP